MTKKQFLNDLRIRLSNLPYSDQRRSLDYYSEMIDDRIEEGLSEEDAVKHIGTPAMVATQIMEELPLATLARARMNGSRSALATVLIILGSPIWIVLLAVAFSLVITAFAVLFSLIAVIFSLVATLWAVELSFAAGSLGGILGSVLIIALEKNIMLGIFFFGAGLMLIALTIFCYYAAIYGTKGLIWLCGCIFKAYKQICRFIKFCLIRKETIQ